MNIIIVKSFLIWLGIIPLAILNGGLREKILLPLLGPIGLPLSGIILCITVFLLTYIFIPLLGNGNNTTYIKMGLLWIVSTIVFEFSLGFATGDSFSEMINAYNITTGNLWIIVVLFIGFAPWITATLRKII